MATRIREFPWADHELGPLESWPSSLRAAVAACLASRTPMQLWVGPHAIAFYNDAAVPLLGTAHPSALGANVSTAQSERWSALRCHFERALAEGSCVDHEGTVLTPVVDDAGTLSNVFVSHPTHDLIAVLAHELRNPLGVLATSVQALMLSSPSREVDLVARALGDVTWLVDDLLDVSRRTGRAMRIRYERTEIATVVDRALELVQAHARGRGVELVADVTRTGIHVEADRERLARAIANTISHVLQHSPLGTRLNVLAVRESERVRLAVQHHLLANAAESLALATARSLVDMHSGTLLVRESEHVLELPLAPAVDVHVPATGTRRRVLIVEDHDDSARALQLALEDRGYTVAIAHDGPVALNLARAFAPDVVLVDIGLPVMDGWELARRMRAHGAELRFVAITGRAEASAQRLSEDLGFADHLVKPIDLGRLEELVETL